MSMTKNIEKMFVDDLDDNWVKKMKMKMMMMWMMLVNEDESNEMTKRRKFSCGDNLIDTYM